MSVPDVTLGCLGMIECVDFMIYNAEQAGLLQSKRPNLGPGWICLR